MTKPEQHDPTVRMIQPPQPIPVFNCQVIVTPATAGTPCRGRSANYLGIEATGESERAVLQQIVKTFKAKASEAMARGQEVQAIDPPESPKAGEVLRWIAVHL